MKWTLGPPTPSVGLPLKVSANGRYLTDQGGTPFLIVGDSPQGAVVCLSLAEMDTYLNDRASRGFNSIQVHVVAGSNFGGRGDLSTYDGLTPFTSAGDVTTPRETYFARLDALVSKAAALGIVCWLDAAETIDSETLWQNAGTTNCRTFGQYLGNRYKNNTNIVWNYGNDFQDWDTNTAARNAVLAIVDGIKDNDSNHLHTAWLEYYLSATRDSTDFDSRCEIDLGYSYYPSYDIILDEYAKTPAKPVHLGEANYEGESLQGYTSTPFVIRKQMWWAVTSGANGHFYCNVDIWHFLSGWASRLTPTSYPGLGHVAHLTALCNEWGWQTWVPDTGSVILTAGRGTYANGNSGSINTNDYATACANPDHSVVVVYIPTSRQITIDMSQLAGSTARCRWYNPQDGTYTAIGTYSCSSTRNFTPPDANDWALVIDRAS
jgi:hypothetical protein